MQDVAMIISMKILEISTAQITQSITQQNLTARGKSQSARIL